MSGKNVFFRKGDKRVLIEITAAVDKIVRKYHGTGNGAVMADYCVEAAVMILATSLLGDAETGVLSPNRRKFQNPLHPCWRRSTFDQRAGIRLTHVPALRTVASTGIAGI